MALYMNMNASPVMAAGLGEVGLRVYVRRELLRRRRRRGRPGAEFN